MKKITVPLSGITRNTDDTISTDGDCMELINVRIKNGSALPVGKPVLLKSFGGAYISGFYHSLAKRYVFIKENGSIVAYDENFSNIQNLTTLTHTVERLEFIGYTLCALTEAGIYYFIFKKGAYKYIGSKPQYNISFWANESKDIEVKYDFAFQFTEGNTPSLMDYRDISAFLDTMNSYRNKALDPYKNEGRLSDPVCVRAALRMYNGDYIAHSPVYVIFPHKKTSAAGYLENISKIYTGVGNPPKPAIGITEVLNTYRIKYNYSIDDIEAWSDIITSLDIFVSRPINIIDVEALNSEGINIAGDVPLINVYSWQKMGEKLIETASLLYLSESKTGNSGNGYLKSSEVTNKKLTDDQFSRNLISGKSSYVYNSRLHIANIRNTLFQGFGVELALSPDYGSYNGYPLSSSVMRVKIYTFINTDSGEKVVLFEGNTINPLNPLFCYPDYRSSKAIIYAIVGTGNGKAVYKKQELSLSRGNLNLSYYLGWDHEYDRIAPIDLLKGNTITEAEFNNPNITTDNIEDNPNKLKVSELNNPFSFPSEQTYTVSNNDIIGMASATAALSSGQFGQFPLYIFSLDGIYALSVGLGDTTYSGSHPVSRDICINSKSITSTDNAVVFASDAGIMLLSGSEIIKISEKLGGYLSSSFSSSPVLGKIMNIPKLQESMVEFRDYIENASIGYIYEEKEVVVSNKQYPYSYVYNLQSGEWYKLSVTAISFLNSYPKTLALCADNSGCGVYNFYNPHRTINDIAIITRPVKFGSLTHKRILQSALRGIIKPSLSDVYFRGEPVQFREENISIFSQAGFYILGSNDAEHFILLAGTERLNDIRDLITKMNKTKAYKYFIFCLVGGVRTDVAINYIEVMADETYDNRLR